MKQSFNEFLNLLKRAKTQDLQPHVMCMTGVIYSIYIFRNVELITKIYFTVKSIILNLKKITYVIFCFLKISSLVVVIIVTTETAVYPQSNPGTTPNDDTAADETTIPVPQESPEAKPDGDDNHPDVIDESLQNSPPEKNPNWKFNPRGKFSLYYYQLPVEKYSLTGSNKVLTADKKQLELSPELQYHNALTVRIDNQLELINGNFLKSPEFEYLHSYAQFNDLFHTGYDIKYSDDYLLRTNFSRAYVKYLHDDFTVIAGRQQIRFGSGRIWNVLDVLNPISPLSNADSTKGTDALRAEYYPGDMAELSIIIDPKRTNDNLNETDIDSTNVLLRGKTTISDTETALLLGRVANRVVAGADASTIFFGGLLRSAVLYSKPAGENFFIQAGGGYEYTFGFGLYFLSEYFYNQSGINYNSRMKNALAETALSGMTQKNYFLLANQFITFNKHYLSNVFAYDIFPLLRGEIFFIGDLQGRGLLMSPTIKFNALENLDLSLNIYSAKIFDGAPNSSDFSDMENNLNVNVYLSLYF